MNQPISHELNEPDEEVIEVLESDVLESRVHALVDNPTDEVIAEG